LRELIPIQALAYQRQGSGWTPDMLLDNDCGGSGGLFSTTGDLLI
jgi:hypothetical protein